jgi:hypothetical protein
VKSWTSVGDAPQSADGKPCGEYPRQVSSNSRSQERLRRDAGTGCIILPLPAVPAGPRLSLTWEGEGDARKAVKVGVATEHAPTRLFSGEQRCKPDQAGKLPNQQACTPARVVLQVQGQTARGTRLIYRAVLRPDGNGKLATEVHLPAPKGVRRICAEAAFAYGSSGWLEGNCPSKDDGSGRAVIELRP